MVSLLYCIKVLLTIYFYPYRGKNSGRKDSDFTGIFERIHELAKNKGITITELQSELGFGRTIISKWNGTSTPKIDSVVKIAEYFNVSVDYLLGRTNNPLPDSVLNSITPQMSKLINLIANSKFSDQQIAVILRYVEDITDF